MVADSAPSNTSPWPTHLWDHSPSSFADKMAADALRKSLSEIQIGGTDEHGDASVAVLWKTEARHHVYKLRQLANAILRLATIRSGAASRAELKAAASSLGSLNRDLGLPVDPGAQCACAQDLRDLSLNLVALFGRTAGAVIKSADLMPLTLARGRRRALMLVASEAIINALRHAFRDRDGGGIAVTLAAHGGRGRLVTADDGIGIPAVAEGAGAGLIDRLARPRGGQLATITSQTSGGISAGFGFPVTPAPTTESRPMPETMRGDA